MSKFRGLHHRFVSFYVAELFVALFQPIFVFLTGCSATLNLAGAALFYAFEFGPNKNIGGFFDAVYFSVTTTTGVGFGDISPVTQAGKIVAMGLMLLGTALFAAFTATLASTLLELELKRRTLHQHH